MDIVNLVIFSTDSDYGLALAEALSALKGNFIIEVRGEEKELPEIRNFDLLIFDCDGVEANAIFRGDKRVIRLSGSWDAVIKNLEPPCFILYKYAMAKDIASDILLYYSMLTGRKCFTQIDINSKIVAFCSGTGGTGKTSVALGVGQALRRYYSKSVLYISMEEIESTLLYMNSRDEGFGICDYLYYLFKSDGTKPDSGAFMIHDKYGISAFMPDKGRNRLRELDTGHLSLFFKEISENGGYDYILIDMGECFGDEMNWLLNACHKATVVLSPDMEGNERQRRFMKYLNFAIGDRSGEVLINAVNKVTDRDNADEAGDTIYIDFDEASMVKADEIFEISIDQDFGAGIKELAKRIL